MQLSSPGASGMLLVRINVQSKCRRVLYSNLHRRYGLLPSVLCPSFIAVLFRERQIAATAGVTSGQLAKHVAKYGPLRMKTVEFRVGAVFRMCDAAPVHHVCANGTGDSPRLYFSVRNLVAASGKSAYAAGPIGVGAEVASGVGAGVGASAATGNSPPPPPPPPPPLPVPPSRAKGSVCKSSAAAAATAPSPGNGATRKPSPPSSPLPRAKGSIWGPPLPSQTKGGIRKPAAAVPPSPAKGATRKPPPPPPPLPRAKGSPKRPAPPLPSRADGAMCEPAPPLSSRVKLANEAIGGALAVADTRTGGEGKGEIRGKDKASGEGPLHHNEENGDGAGGAKKKSRQGDGGAGKGIATVSNKE